MPTQPNPFAVISRIASDIRVPSGDSAAGLVTSSAAAGVALVSMLARVRVGSDNARRAGP